MLPGLILLAVIVVLIAAAGAVYAVFRSPLPQTQGTRRAAGLEGRAEILRDRWGAPHIYAGSEHDLFFAQGYAHAQDRLWQMELQRRAGSGRLSEVLGETTLAVDRFFRVVGLNRASEAELETLDDETRAALDAYAQGVNAYLAGPGRRLPVEFRLLRFEPEPWHPVDSLYWSKVMAWNLSANWAGELIRARLAARLGAGRAADLEPSYPDDNPPIAHGTHSVGGAAPAPNGWGSAALRDALARIEGLVIPASPPANPAGRPPGPVQSGGNSNQWVVAGSRSATGRPLLANDTHLALQMPALWYQVHLEGGRYHVAGVSLPGAPGVVVGHNARCAWGMTTAWQDAQDLYVERLNPANPHQYEYQGAWLDAEVIHEEIQVKGRAEPVVQEVVVTRHGPIISELVGEPVPLALRWVALESGRAVSAVLKYDRATNWAEFRAALEGWSAPAHNFCYADLDGNIGFLQAGWVPVRGALAGGGQAGMAPVPGWTGEGEWQRMLSIDELPQAYNPESGWLATANNLVVDGAYPHYLSADLENPCRARRIVDLLTGRPTCTADDFACFQRDTYSAQAERFTRHLAAIEPQTDAEQGALEWLKGWDYYLDQDSVAATLYQVTRLRALHLMFDDHLGHLAGVYIGLGLTPLDETSPYHDRSFMRLLDLLDGRGDLSWLNDPETGQPRSCQLLLRQALREAIVLLEGELGRRMERWQYGKVNRVYFAHPVGSVKPLNLIFNRGPFPSGGDRDTLLRAIGRPEFPFKPAAVVDAMRFIADLGDWEKCRIIVPGGQSGQPASRHYDDLIKPWLEGEFQEMPFARARVEQLSRERLDLLPE